MSSTRLLTLVGLLVAASAVDATPASPLEARASSCNADNLLRRFRDTRYSDGATSFCQTFIDAYTHTTVTVTTVASAIPSVTTTPYSYPSPLLTTSYPDERLSSACSCIDLATKTKTDTTYVPAPTDTALGCWTEGIGGAKALSEKHFNTSMTVEKCASLCTGSAFYGVEYGVECYCGDAVQNGAFRTDVKACDIPCAGNLAQQCGGRSFINIYQVAGSTATLPPATPTQAVYPYAYAGCYAEPASGAKALSTVYQVADMTREMCFYDCYNGGYKFAGLEYGTECWCGNELANGTAHVDDAVCNMPCGGNPAETCGAGNTLQLYVNGVAAS
ncbi:uncharacterized protein E0L32_003011 [Thyridium curvatum]|uniref:WSC domain-containing protein n=1 Tax=Thyridium curvatum TaxID=1093900 RepID=A0A507BMF7_9PEZI|nr:uncharacterized protein E0L32_003011 [Thyridium curvatum]TPX17910.1 hypothetical protein E0L32_003011 [Thyridium curvatum]